MNIQKAKLSWTAPLEERGATSYIILHHSAGTGSVEGVHKQHILNGWAGIGYHFYVRKNGEIYEGRPETKVGAHCRGSNKASVGVCFEGNFENEEMSDVQLKSGTELVQYLKAKYPNAKIVRHSDMMSTACPGKSFPFERLEKINTSVPTVTSPLTSANDITWELKQRIEITDTDGFVKALNEAKQKNSPLYWGYYKIVNASEQDF